MKKEKGNGKPGPGKQRWVMRNSDGTVFETTGHYYKEEVEEWECSSPQCPIVYKRRGASDGT